MALHRCSLVIGGCALFALSCSSSEKVAPIEEWPGIENAQESVPFVAGKNGYAVYRVPTIVRTNAGTILAFAEGRVNGPGDEGDINVVLRRSKDEGKTWESLQTIADDGKNPCKNQCPVVLPSGRIVLVWLWNESIPSEADRTTRDVYVQYSDDDGVTWSPRENVTQSTQEPNWGWTGMGPVHGIVKQFAPHQGRIVFAARHNMADTDMRAHVIYSDDGGVSWKIGGTVLRDKTTESTVVELSNGNLMVNSRNQKESENHRVVSISKDGGETFTESFVEEQLIEPSGVQASLLFYSMNDKTGKGNLFFSNPAHPELRSNGTLKLSIDDGKTWSEGIRYAPKKAPYFSGYSDIVKLGNGDVGVLYERGEVSESDPKGDRYDEIGFTVVPANLFRGLE